MTPRVREILGWYRSENAGTLTNLASLLNHGVLGGTGRMVILPIDQGFEHGPDRNFAANPSGYDPRYHFELAIESGGNAYAAPFGFLEAGRVELAREVPLILKLNSHDLLHEDHDPTPALTSSVREGHPVAPLRRRLHAVSWVGQEPRDVSAVSEGRRRRETSRPGRGGMVVSPRLGSEPNGGDGGRCRCVRRAHCGPAGRAHRATDRGKTIGDVATDGRLRR